MRAGDDLHADDLADLRGGGCAGVGGGFHAGDVALEEGGDIAGSDFFPAGEGDVRGLERGVGGLEEGAEALAFDHADCLVSHFSSGELMVEG